MATATGIRSKFRFVKKSTVVAIAIFVFIMALLGFASQPPFWEVVVGTIIIAITAGILVLDDWIYSN